MAALPPPDETSISFFHWIVGVIGGAVGAAITGVVTVWNISSIVTSFRRDVEQNAKDVIALKKQVEDKTTADEKKHADNQMAIHQLSLAVAAQPDKEDFRNLQRDISDRLADLKRTLDAAPTRLSGRQG